MSDGALNFNFDYTEAKAAEEKDSGGKKFDPTQILTNTPPETSPLICKLISPSVNDKIRPLTGDVMKRVWEIKVIPHMMPGQEYAWSHIDQKSLGAPDSPELEAYFAAYKELKAMNKETDLSTPEWAAATRVVNALKPKDAYWVYFVTPNDPKVRALKLSISAYNQLFGKEAYGEYPAIASVVDNMIAEGNNPYDLKSETGWLKIYHRGERKGTRHFVEPATQMVEATLSSGKKTTVAEPLVAKVHADVFKAKQEDLPDLVDREVRFGFTYEEAVEFAATLETPQRLITEARERADKEAKRKGGKTNAVSPAIASGSSTTETSPAPEDSDEAF